MDAMYKVNIVLRILMESNSKILSPFFSSKKQGWFQMISLIVKRLTNTVFITLSSFNVGTLKLFHLMSKLNLVKMLNS